MVWCTLPNIKWYLSGAEIDLHRHGNNQRTKFAGLLAHEGAARRGHGGKRSDTMDLELEMNIVGGSAPSDIYL